MSSTALLWSLCLLLGCVAAFGAGNIPSFGKIEGSAFRHGDIEDILLQLIMIPSYGLDSLNPFTAAGKKFSRIVSAF